MLFYTEICNELLKIMLKKTSIKKLFLVIDLLKLQSLVNLPIVFTYDNVLIQNHFKRRLQYCTFTYISY